MRPVLRLLFVVLAMAIVTPAIHAQEADKKAQQDEKGENKKAAAAEPQVPEVPLKVQVILSEFDGDRKISSLPYVIYTVAGARPDFSMGHLRVGVRVPILTATGKTQVDGTYAQPISAVSYQDVGTSLDCRVAARPDSQFRVEMSFDRSSVVTQANGKESDWKPGDPSPADQPLLGQFRGDFIVVVHRGQTTEAASLSDPITGHVLKVEVTLQVL